MLICPKCKREINTLKNSQTGTMDFEIGIDSQGDSQYSEMDFEVDGESNDFNCPLCQETLFTDETEAIDFLKQT